MPHLRTIIAGSRSITDYWTLYSTMLEIDWTPSVVLSGTARGADTLGEWWAAEHGVVVERYPADWTNLGKRAGNVRNVQMASAAQALVALWDGQSRGTAHMVRIARNYRLRVHVVNLATARGTRASR